MKMGSRVKYSEYALRPKRDYWQRCGREPHKSNAKDGFDATCAVRGTITAILKRGIEVTEDNGSIHRSLSWMWDLE